MCVKRMKILSDNRQNLERYYRHSGPDFEADCLPRFEIGGVEQRFPAM